MLSDWKGMEKKISINGSVIFDGNDRNAERMMPKQIIYIRDLFKQEIQNQVG